MICLALLLLAVLHAVPAQSCHTSLAPLFTHEVTEEVHGVPVLVDGAAVSLRCKF